MKKVVMAEVIKLLDASMIYPISDSSWVSPVQVVPKKWGMIVIQNEKKMNWSLLRKWLGEKYLLIIGS